MERIILFIYRRNELNLSLTRLSSTQCAFVIFVDYCEITDLDYADDVAMLAIRMTLNGVVLLPLAGQNDLEACLSYSCEAARAMGLNVS